MGHPLRSNLKSSCSNPWGLLPRGGGTVYEVLCEMIDWDFLGARDKQVLQIITIFYLFL